MASFTHTLIGNRRCPPEETLNTLRLSTIRIVRLTFDGA